MKRTAESGGIFSRPLHGLVERSACKPSTEVLGYSQTSRSAGLIRGIDALDLRLQAKANLPANGALMRRYLLHYILPLLGLAGICLLNSFLFHKIFGGGWRGYLDWYVRAGPFIGLAQVAFAVSWEALDKNTSLVSAHPLKYIGGCCWLVGLPLEALGGHLRTKGQHLETKNYDRLNPWDVIVALPMILLFVVAALAWLLLIAPLQYFLFLICGAPSRVALTSEYRLHADLKDNSLKSIEPKRDEPAPTTGWDASMSNKPVTMANAFGAAVLFIVGYFLH